MLTTRIKVEPTTANHYKYQKIQIEIQNSGQIFGTQMQKEVVCSILA